MRLALAAVLLVAAVSCNGSSHSGATPSGAGLLSDPCAYVSPSDFENTIGMPLQGYRAGESCSYRDPQGNTCQVTVLADSGQYVASKKAAAQYGAVEALATGDQGYYSAQSQVPGVWIFDVGFMKGSAFAGALCGARFGASNPRPQALRLASLIASRL